MRRGAAAEKVGVTRQAIHQYCLRHPEFKELVSEAEADACDVVENVLFQKAIAGHFPSIVFWLLNRSEGRWTDKRAAPIITQTVQPDPDVKDMIGELAATIEKAKGKKAKAKKTDEEKGGE